ncbi:MAG: soluble methane monooxygenase-binding protein MmoD [Betaproteobacteria bacterium HGW-Betaproteobacteria-1]|jgi:soluble methane monooxygenase-binding protein MmoD|nr:MAG: soluble methane monooxygenase-binding protein MmoD [Betaproteobacteria bacterium HGW-Betaproteobacteria-1]
MNANIDEETDFSPSVEKGLLEKLEVFERIELQRSANYSAYTEDLGFMWRWQIFRDSELAQHGCSLSLESSREAVRHVLVYFQGIDKNRKNNPV